MEILSPAQKALADAIADTVAAERGTNPALSVCDVLAVLQYLTAATAAALADAIDDERAEEDWKKGGAPA